VPALALAGETLLNTAPVDTAEEIVGVTGGAVSLLESRG